MEKNKLIELQKELSNYKDLLAKSLSKISEEVVNLQYIQHFKTIDSFEKALIKETISKFLNEIDVSRHKLTEVTDELDNCEQQIIYLNFKNKIKTA